MKSTKYLKYIASGIVISLFAGCANNQAVINTSANKSIKSVSSSNVKIKLPSRYSVEEFKEIKMVTQFTGDKDTKDVIDLIETDVMGIKKFKQYARHMGDKAALRDEMHRETAGADIEAGKIPVKSDYILAVKIDKTKTEQKLSDTKSLILFSTELKYQINKEKDGQNITSGVIKGQAKRYKTYKAHWNSTLRRNFYKQTGGHGFNGNVKKSDEDAFRQASQRASKILKYRVGNTFPAGGMIMTWREAEGSHQIVLDSGINQGIMDNQYFVIYTNDAGVDTPIALAKVSSVAEEQTTLSLEKWKDNDPFAKKIINSIKKSNYNLGSKDFFAVAIAMPDPRYND
jgi:hypothetical protein